METPRLGTDVTAETLSHTTPAAANRASSVPLSAPTPFSVTLAWPLVLFLTARSGESQVSDGDAVLGRKVGALRAQPSKSKVPKIRAVPEKSAGRRQRQIYVSSKADNSIQKP